MGVPELTGYEVALLAKAYELLSRFGLQYDIETFYGQGASRGPGVALWFKVNTPLDAGKKAKFAELTGLDCFKWRSGTGSHTGIREFYENQWTVEGSKQEIFESIKAALKHKDTPKPEFTELT